MWKTTLAEMEVYHGWDVYLKKELDSYIVSPSARFKLARKNQYWNVETVPIIEFS